MQRAGGDVYQQFGRVDEYRASLICVRSACLIVDNHIRIGRKDHEDSGEQAGHR